MNNSKTYFWSDLHLDHNKMYNLPFTSIHNPSKPMRPFKTAQEADDYMIEQYNKIVKPGDKVYFLGDIAMTKKGLSKMSLMQKGHNYLIMGNHDKQGPILDYAKYFNKIYGALYLPKLRAIATHIPIHESFVCDRFDWNIHGHLHDQTLTKVCYINVSVEITEFKPLTFEEALETCV